MNGLDKSKKIIKRKPLTEKQAIQIMTKRRACIEKFRKTLKKAPIKAPRKKKENKETLPDKEKDEEKDEDGEPEDKPKPKKPRAKKAPVHVEEPELHPILDEASIAPPEDKPKEKKKRAKKVIEPSGPIDESVVGEPEPIKEKKPRKKPVKKTKENTENPENIL
jgi:hypothetical protein